MSNVAKLKKQAAEFELKRQFDKALAIYTKLLDSFDQNAGELDVGLFNRVGDLMLRQGNVADAVDYYEKAVDRYADTGFFNNAIALCNKILRHSPGRATVYYKLGKISAQKGFKNDAKVNFLEYADRMQKSGNVDESFRALKEFADLCPDQDEIRVTLADQLIKANRKAEAIEQFQRLHERYESEGRTTEAAEVTERMRALDPSAAPRSTGAVHRRASSGDLVFLDLDTPPTRVTGESSRPPTPVVQLGFIPSKGHASTPVEGLPDVQRAVEEDSEIERAPSSSPLAGLQSTSLSEETAASTPPSPQLLDLEPTSLVEPNPPIDRSPNPTHAMLDQSIAAGGDLELIMPEPREDTPPGGMASIDFDLSMLTPPPPTLPKTRPTPNTSRAVLEGLPLMDLELPSEAQRSTPAVARTPVEPLPLSDELELIEESSDEETVGGPTGDGRASPATPAAPIATSTIEAAHSVEVLKANVGAQPNNWGLHRDLAEAMLDAGERGGGIKELELAMIGAERSGDLDLASSIAEEIARIEPDSVKHHQKRVEYAFRTNDRARLIEAYLSLADALLRGEQLDKARTVYQRVLDLTPDEARARAALDAIAMPEPPAAPVTSAVVDQRPANALAGSESPSRNSPRPSAEHFVNLGDWLRDSEGPKDTRMVVDEQEPTGDEEADFADMLRKFKQGVAENVDAEDYQSHYDLAIAFKEMGLLDEAIAEFQKALGSPTNRLRTYEALGQCFLDKGSFKLAASILGRAMNEKGSEEQMLGVYYLLGRASEALGQIDEAVAYYQRVFVLDIQFRDVAERLSQLERAPR